MDRGIYAATSGGLQVTRKLDIVANNIANVSTVGFKGQRLISREQTFAETLASSLKGIPERAKEDFKQVPGVVDLGVTTDFSPGPIQVTGNALDAALTKENQFFVVQTPQGEALTRAGNFTVDVEGNLVTADGYKVLGDGGGLQLPAGTPHLSQKGTITVNDETVGKLRIVEVSDLTQLERTDGVRFRVTGNATLQNVEADIEPQSLEMSNINIMDGMVQMITTQRGFEAYTKTIRAVDELNDRAIRLARN